MRKCQAPGPWKCPACGNQNYATRMVCNMRRCQQPRPGTPAVVGGQNLQALAQLLGPHGVKGLQTLLGGTKPQGFNGGPKPKASHTPPEGAWVCIECGNVNYPSRTSCNAIKCGRPRNEVDGGPPAHTEATEGETEPLEQTMPDGANFGMAPAAGLQMHAGGGSYPEGSWVCQACTNVNFPGRQNCNKNGCGLPREQSDGGPPQPKPQPPIPDGSWPCRHCGNMNYPSRATCNMRTCGKARYG